MAETPIQQNRQTSNLSCLISTESSGEKYTNVVSIGAISEGFTWSRCKLGMGGVWSHETIVLDSAAPTSFYPICTLPTRSTISDRSLSPEQLGFCTVSAENGEVYHVFKTTSGKWNIRQITAINLTPEAKELSIHWCFYLWEGSCNLLLLHGADWTNYSWKTDTVLGHRVLFQGAGEFGISHASCAGSIVGLLHNSHMFFYFRGTSGLIYECVRSGPDWLLYDLSKLATSSTSVTPPRPSSSDLSVVENNGTVHIFYIGQDNRLRELYKFPGKPWRHVSLRRHVGGSVCALPPQSQPFACFDSEQCLHVFFKNDENTLSECYWKRRRHKWRIYDTSDYIPAHGAVERIFDVVSDEGPHLYFASADGVTRSTTFHHVHWTNNDWISEYWGTREGIQLDESFPSSPVLSSSPVIPLGKFASSSTAASQNSDPHYSSSHNGIAAPIPVAPVAPAPPPPAPALPVKITVNKVSAAKPPLFIRLPMNDGKHSGKLHKYQRVRLVIISDTHNYAGRVGALPEGDILVHCGDFTVYGKCAEIEEFAAWLDEQTQFKYKIVIAGNHETNPSKAKSILEKHCIWLDDRAATVMGLDFYGTTWGCKYAKLPTTGVDILLTHKPPTGNGDIIHSGESRGSESLATAVRAMKPIIHAFGHNHEGFGATCDKHTVYINAATCLGGAKSTARRGSIVVDVYPELKSKYGGLGTETPEELSSSGIDSLASAASKFLPF